MEIVNSAFNLIGSKIFVVLAGVAGEVVVASEGLVFGQNSPLYEAVESLKALLLSDKTVMILTDCAEDLRSRGILNALWLTIAVFRRRVWEFPQNVSSALLLHDSVVGPEVLILEHSHHPFFIAPLARAVRSVP